MHKVAKRSAFPGNSMSSQPVISPLNRFVKKLVCGKQMTINNFLEILDISLNDFRVMTSQNWRIFAHNHHLTSNSDNIASVAHIVLGILYIVISV